MKRYPIIYSITLSIFSFVIFSFLLGGCTCAIKSKSCQDDCTKACCAEAKAQASCPMSSKACGACPAVVQMGPGGFPPLPEGQELPPRDRLPEYGYVDLFDGKTLDGWSMAGPGEFILEHGVLETKDGMGLLWYNKKPFKNFTLVVEWMNHRQEDNSGIFVRFPDPGNDPWVAVNGGYEIQIDDKSAPPNCSGSIYSIAPATKLMTYGPMRWNRYEITVVGQQYTIVVNGEKVCDFTGDRSVEGYIGLQNHDPKSKVRFRRVAIKEL